MLFDLKIIGSVLEELQEQKGVSKDEVLFAIEESLASAYKKQYGERGQIVRAKFNLDTGDVDFFRVKEVVSPDQIIPDDELEAMDKEQYLAAKEKGKIKFIDQRHILLENAKLVKAGVEAGEELSFELEKKTDFGRVAAQAAKQTIKQKIREAERGYIQKMFGDKEGTIVEGEVVRVETGTIFINLGNTEGIMPFFEQIKSEKYQTGDKILAYLVKAGEGRRGGVELLLSRTHPEFLKKLFEQEVPEIGEGLVEIVKVVREPGFRAKIAVKAFDEDLDPIGTFVGQGGSRVTTVSSELAGERIDIIEWSEDEKDFIAQSLSPASIMDIEIIENDEYKTARVYVLEDQFSLAIGRGGQNSRLAAKLTGMKIDIKVVDEEGNEVKKEDMKREEKKVIVVEEKVEVEEVKEDAIDEEVIENESQPEEKEKEDVKEVVKESESESEPEIKEEEKKEEK